MPNLINITGRRFGRWTVLRREAYPKWLCLCDCGTEKAVDGMTLRNGRSISCGCWRTEVTKRHRTTHGMAKKGHITPEWSLWSNMKQRCSNHLNTSYPRYGGRGIVVCDRWLASFDNFLADMGPRPTMYSTLERLDNDGPYSPDNCCWADRTTQARNTRQNRVITFEGHTLTLSEWAQRTGLKASTIAYRLSHGCSVEQALTTLIATRP